MVKKKSVDSEKPLEIQESTIKWNFNKEPLYKNSERFEELKDEHEIDVVHHLKLTKDLGIFENSGDYSN